MVLIQHLQWWVATSLPPLYPILTTNYSDYLVNIHIHPSSSRFLTWALKGLWVNPTNFPLIVPDLLWGRCVWLLIPWSEGERESNMKWKKYIKPCSRCAVNVECARGCATNHNYLSLWKIVSWSMFTIIFVFISYNHNIITHTATLVADYYLH